MKALNRLQKKNTKFEENQDHKQLKTDKIEITEVEEYNHVVDEEESSKSDFYVLLFLY